MSSITNDLLFLHKNEYIILFDTGSSINFIHPDIIKHNNTKIYNKILTFKTVNGKSKCTQFKNIFIHKKTNIFTIFMKLIIFY